MIHYKNLLVGSLLLNLALSTLLISNLFFTENKSVKTSEETVKIEKIAQPEAVIIDKRPQNSVSNNPDRRLNLNTLKSKGESEKYVEPPTKHEKKIPDAAAPIKKSQNNTNFLNDALQKELRGRLNEQSFGLKKTQKINIKPKKVNSDFQNEIQKKLRKMRTTFDRKAETGESFDPVNLTSSKFLGAVVDKTPTQESKVTISDVQKPESIVSKEVE